MQRVSDIAAPSRSIRDWLVLLALGAMWGSAFMFTKVALASMPPATVAAGRIAIGAIVLVGVLYARGLRLPPPGPLWRAYTVLAILGNAVPFYLIAWGQQRIDSALAGILIAAMPLGTLVLAHYFVHDDRITRSRATGFTVGFAGIVLLMGPAALSGLAGSVLQIASQLAVLTAALCYAANSVLARRTLRGDVLVASAGVLLLASAFMVPVALLIDRPWTLAPSFSSIVAIAWLGAGATGLATICYFALIASAGPTFMSLVNYLNPCVALVLGVTVMQETPGPAAYAGLALILVGIALSQFRRRFATS